jgi:hypothetical protein
LKPGTGDGKMGTGEGERDWKTDFFFPTEERPEPRRDRILWHQMTKVILVIDLQKN